MKKKFLCTILCISMAASMLVGCGSNSDSKDSGTAEEGTAADNEASQDTGAETPADSEADSGNSYEQYAGTTIHVAAIETAYGSEMWHQKCGGNRNGEPCQGTPKYSGTLYKAVLHV